MNDVPRTDEAGRELDTGDGRGEGHVARVHSFPGNQMRLDSRHVRLGIQAADLKTDLIFPNFVDSSRRFLIWRKIYLDITQSYYPWQLNFVSLKILGK